MQKRLFANALDLRLFSIKPSEQSIIYDNKI